LSSPLLSPSLRLPPLVHNRRIPNPLNPILAFLPTSFPLLIQGGGPLLHPRQRQVLAASMRTLPSLPPSIPPSVTAFLEQLLSRVPKGFGQFYPKEAGAAGETAGETAGKEGGWVGGWGREGRGEGGREGRKHVGVTSVYAPFSLIFFHLTCLISR